MIGVTAQDPDSLTSLPSTANSIKISPWIVVNNAVYVNGNKVRYQRAKNEKIKPIENVLSKYN